MTRTAFTVGTISLLLPLGAVAAPATFVAPESPLASTSIPGNAYVIGDAVVITAPVAGDLLAFGASVFAAGAISEDALLVGGRVGVRAPVAGDLRALGYRVRVIEGVKGDIVSVGYHVDLEKPAKGSVFIAAANASVVGGAEGPVTIYGNNVLLSGEFTEDVRVFATGVVRLAPETRISGILSYEAPELAKIPEEAVIEGGVEYTNASYLPGAETSRVLSIVSIGIFLLVRVVGALILAGLLAGLFPRLAHAVADRALTGSMRRTLLTILLGFAVLVATPILLVLLSITFVGLGIALLLGTLYMLLAMLAVLYTGITLGVLMTRRFADRDTIAWHDGVLGMLALSLIAFVPVIGGALAALGTVFVAGVLIVLFFGAAFPHDD